MRRMPSFLLLYRLTNKIAPGTDHPTLDVIKTTQHTMTPLCVAGKVLPARIMGRGRGAEGGCAAGFT